MKKSLCLLALCFSMLGTYAQDDDVYFVPSSKNKKSQQQRTEQQAFPEGRSTYTPIEQDATFEESNWALIHLPSRPVRKPQRNYISWHRVDMELSISQRNLSLS